MKKAFTLLELLVVIAVITLLMSILMPALSAARSQAQTAVCQSNLRQLVLASTGYATENDGSMVLAAEDIWTNNLHRWHGVRENINEPFDSLRSPIAGYLGDGGVKKCPKKVNFRKGDSWEWDFEDGCGGYGYNNTYIGSRIWQSGLGATDKATKITNIGSPADTIMFADTAMSKLDGGVPYYMEYSFVEPRYWFSGGQFHPEWGDPSPSIHFRHRGKANVAWGDGHIDVREMADYDGINAYGVRSADVMLGWFKPMDNTLFDLE